MNVVEIAVGQRWRRNSDGKIIILRRSTSIHTPWKQSWWHWTDGHGKSGDILELNLPRRYTLVGRPDGEEQS